MVESYRKFPDKEQLTGKVPVSLATTIREMAGRERRTLSEVMSHALCLYARADPRVYGIDPRARSRCQTGTRSAASA